MDLPYERLLHPEPLWSLPGTPCLQLASAHAEGVGDSDAQGRPPSHRRRRRLHRLSRVVAGVSRRGPVGSSRADLRVILNGRRASTLTNWRLHLSWSTVSRLQRISRRFSLAPF